MVSIVYIYDVISVFTSYDLICSNIYIIYIMLIIFHQDDNVVFEWFNSCNVNVEEVEPQSSLE
jgi:hypothetical protein